MSPHSRPAARKIFKNRKVDRDATSRGLARPSLSYNPFSARMMGSSRRRSKFGRTGLLLSISYDSPSGLLNRENRAGPLLFAESRSTPGLFASLIASLSTGEGLNVKTRRGAMGASTRVFGLRPVRSRLPRTLKTPNDDNFICSPRTSAFEISSRTISRYSAARVRDSHPRIT
jgi:hypothetical protein